VTLGATLIQSLVQIDGTTAGALNPMQLLVLVVVPDCVLMSSPSVFAR
jgi:hypothetical protein